jgi:hypothetical protein
MISMSCTSLTPSERSVASDRIGAICLDSNLVLSLREEGRGKGLAHLSLRRQKESEWSAEAQLTIL